VTDALMAATAAEFFCCQLIAVSNISNSLLQLLSYASAGITSLLMLLLLDTAVSLLPVCYFLLLQSLSLHAVQSYCYK